MSCSFGLELAKDVLYCSIYLQVSQLSAVY